MSSDKTNSPKLLVYSTLAIFVLALLPRVLTLGSFLTTDEAFWAEKSRDFLGGVLSSEFACSAVMGDGPQAGVALIEPGQGLACTVRAGHPGVITMWTGSLGIWLYYLVEHNGGQSLLEFVENLPVKPVDKALIPWIRLPTAVLTAATIALLFVVLNRLLKEKEGQRGYWIALIATLLMALSPYEIALSRVLHNDALETVFTTFSILAAFNYWVRKGGKRWLIISGLLAGPAFLTKLPALILAPFMALAGIWYLGKVWLTRIGNLSGLLKLLLGTVLAGILWFMASLFSFILFWPAMWVIPVEIANMIFGFVFTHVGEGHDKGFYFLGTISNDPGALFYPVSWLVYTTPLVLIGVLIALVFWVKGDSRLSGQRNKLMQRIGYGSSSQPVEQLFFWSILFVLFFTIFMTSGGLKHYRYLLPAYPFFAIIAAMGWVWLASELEISFLKTKFLPLFIVLILVFNGTLVILNYPYYFTYFNPLLGGRQTVPELITVGWGEGLDRAAAYLNQKPNAGELKVSSWFGSSAFAPFFEGQAIDYYQQKGNALAGDYVVIYIEQTKLRTPDDEFFAFFTRRTEPEKVIEINGVPYAWIYPGVGLDHYVQYERYYDVAELLGWEYTTPGIDPDHPVLKPGEPLEFDLWWEYLGKPPEEAFFLWLVGPDGRLWAEAVTRPKPEVGDPGTWNKGKIVPESGTLIVPAGTPPGDYTIHIGFYPETPSNPDDVLFFGLGDNPRIITIEKAVGASVSLPPLEPLNIDVESLHLSGWQAKQTEIKIDTRFGLELYWQALADVPDRYQVSLALLDELGVVRWEWARVEPVTFYPTDSWRQGEVVRSQLDVQPTVRTPGGQYQLALNVYAEDRHIQTVPLMPIFVQGRQRQFTLAEEIQPLETFFEGDITLLGFQTREKSVYHPGEEFEINLFWQTQKVVESDYTVFVQLLGPDGSVYGQMDSQPQNGETPTGHWTPGEFIKDPYRFMIAEDASAGDYRLITGMYRFETGERLSIEPGGEYFVKLLDVRIDE